MSKPKYIKFRNVKCNQIEFRNPKLHQMFNIKILRESYLETYKWFKFNIEVLYISAS